MAAEIDDWANAQLRKLAKAGSAAPWGRTALMDYLEKVYGFTQRFRKRVEYDDEAFITLARLAGKKKRISRLHPIRAIIDLTSPAGAKQKSKWYRALRYLWARNVSREDMLKEMKAAGGVNACADKWARKRRQAPKKR